MGRPKRRDKTFRKNTMNENEEKRKMRESILKVFWMRAHSPGGGGAVVVNEGSKSTRAVSNSQVKCSHHSHKYYHNARDSSSSSESENDSGTSSRQESKKHKRHRKTVTGQEKKKSDAKAGVGQHIRAAHSFSYSRSTDGVKHKGYDKTDGVSCITRSRLTRNIGLFNPGKKSSTVVRDPIPVPESVQKEVDRTLRHILDHTEDLDERSSRYCDRSKDVGQRLKDRVSDSHYVSDSDTHNSHWTSATHTPASAHHDHNNATHTKGPQHRSEAKNSSAKLTDSDHFSSTDLSHIFPRTPPVQDIADCMLSEFNIQCKNNFKNRDLLAEMCVELKKLLQQNQRTPEVSSVSYHPDSNCSVKRSLISSFSLLTEAEPPCQRPQSAELMESNSAGSALVPPSHTPRYSGHSPSRGSAALDVLHRSSFPSSSALNLFPVQENSLHGERRIAKESTDLRRESSSIELRPCMADTSDLGNGDSAISLLRRNSMISRISSVCGTREAHGASADNPGRTSVESNHQVYQRHLQSAPCPEEYCSGNTNRHERQSSQGSFLEKVMANSSVTDCQYHYRPQDHRCSQPQSVNPEAQQEPDYNQRLHDNYVSQWRLSDVLTDGSGREPTPARYAKNYSKRLTHPPAHQSFDSFPPFAKYRHQDLLDQLDCGIESEAEPPSLNVRKRKHSDCSLTETLTPEYDIWSPEQEQSKFLPPLCKPSLGTPSPPEKLSPHRLY